MGMMTRGSTDLMDSLSADPGQDSIHHLVFTCLHSHEDPDDTSGLWVSMLIQTPSPTVTKHVGILVSPVYTCHSVTRSF